MQTFLNFFFYFSFVSFISAVKLKTCKFVFSSWLIEDVDLLPKLCPNGEKGNVLLSLTTSDESLDFCFTFPKNFKKRNAGMIILRLFNKQYETEEIKCEVNGINHTNLHFNLIEKSEIDQRFKGNILRPGILIQQSKIFAKTTCINGTLYKNLKHRTKPKCICEKSFTGENCDRLI
jgi:hypothetical protein